MGTLALMNTTSQALRASINDLSRRSTGPSPHFMRHFCLNTICLQNDTQRKCNSNLNDASAEHLFRILWLVQSLHRFIGLVANFFVQTEHAIRSLSEEGRVSGPASSSFSMSVDHAGSQTEHLQNRFVVTYA